MIKEFNDRIYKKEKNIVKIHIQSDVGKFPYLGVFLQLK